MKLRVCGAESSRPSVCVYCRDALVLADVLTCTGCGASLHAVCWGEVNKCPSIGCLVEVPVGAERGEGCISCQTPLPEGESGACAGCRAQHDATWTGDRAWDHDGPCPRCQRKLSSAPTATCNVCRVPLHVACWNPLLPCPTPGCPETTPIVRKRSIARVANPRPRKPTGWELISGGALLVLALLLLLAAGNVLDYLSRL